MEKNQYWAVVNKKNGKIEKDVFRGTPEIYTSQRNATICIDESINSYSLETHIAKKVEVKTLN